MKTLKVCECVCVTEIEKDRMTERQNDRKTKTGIQSDRESDRENPQRRINRGLKCKKTADPLELWI